MWTEKNGLWIRPPATRTSREHRVQQRRPVLKAVWLKGLSGTHLRSPRCLLACVLAQHECFGHLARRREPRAQLEETRRRCRHRRVVCGHPCVRRTWYMLNVDHVLRWWECGSD